MKRILILSLLVWPVLAQTPLPKAGDFQLRDKSQRFSPMDMVKEFEGSTSDTYELGEGDEITIEVWGRPELSGKHTIGPDGRITVPVAGSLRVGGLSREAAVQAIGTSLKPYYLDPAVTLRVDRYTSNRVFILGRVANPGAIQFERTPTLLELITRAGSLPVGGAAAEKATLNRCTIFRGNDKVLWIDLKALVAQGNLAYNIRLKRNDIVYVPDSDDQLVYVLGEVQHPGAFRMTPTMTLMDAFGQSGGPTKDGDVNRIRVIRPSRSLTREFTLKELLRPNRELNVGLEEGDILYVPRRGLATFGYFMEKLNSVATLGIFGAAVAK